MEKSPAIEKFFLPEISPLPAVGRNDGEQLERHYRFLDSLDSVSQFGFGNH